MGDIDFVQMVYYVMVTITTVGYGDFSPHTNLSKILTSGFIIIGVLHFNAAVADFQSLSSALSEGQGEYRGQGEHIIAVGGCINSYNDTIKNFLQEMFSDPDGPDVVLLAAIKKTDAIAEAQESLG